MQRPIVPELRAARPAAPSEVETCVFCRKFFVRDGAKWYDAELWGNDEVVVVPALGALTEGSLLLLTRHHFHSMAAASVLVQPALLAAKRLVRSVLEEVYTSVVVFEHGASAAGGGGSCIDHAHFQFLPGVPDLAAVLRDRHELPVLQDDELSTLADTAYLLVDEGADRTYAAPVGAVPGQYVRRIAAELLGRPDEWDYDVFPGYEEIRSTIGTLQPRFALAG